MAPYMRVNGGTIKRMGKVRFAEIEVFLLGDTAALVLGQWQLQRQTDPVGGSFSIVFQRIDGVWVIIHDHTSRTPAAIAEPNQTSEAHRRPKSFTAGS